ncbi:uncharacterized protein BCR38DRAFT_429145 [Pseudomassariella vexata]|uniref:Uncharacterized protein n=1 Tax=Pseudomassariella vexata TaxID=1141098 RepID=A0A1Y2E3P4_9PEZI|nr:uncharacterized protein BCR38DRAFT_429145 [Pseudomassariella vexata]ORY66067.1 hypothetical protein BCR38DRAFT_429145 [Pseudomassariella vexata]
MGSDAVYRGGELRPHTWHPLPDTSTPHPFTTTVLKSVGRRDTSSIILGMADNSHFTCLKSQRMLHRFTTIFR